MTLALAKKPQRPSVWHRRRGLSLLELVAAMATSAVLMVGMASVILIAGHGADLTGPTADTIHASEVAHELMDEIRYAIFVTERSDNMIQFAVADRDGDGQAEVIRYEWSGTPGDPLTRTINHGTPDTVAEDVYDFTLTYNVREKTEGFTGLQESLEQKFVEYTSTSDPGGHNVTDLKWRGQYFHPSDFNVTQLPTDAVSWSVTRVEFQAKQRNSPTGQTWVQLRSSTGGNKPTSTVLDQVLMLESDLGTSYSWMNFVFNGVSRRSPSQGLCLVLQWVSGSESARVRYNVAGKDYLKTLDAGATWTYYGGRSMLYRLYGKYFTPSQTQTNVTRRYLTGVNLAMQIGDSAYSRVDAGTNLLNTPELLSAFWKVDFDADPTTADADFDGNSDWVEETGTFDPASLAGGVWQADEADGVALRTSPDNDFTDVTTVDIKCRNTSVGGSGANFWMHFDRTGSGYGELYTSVALQTDGTQTARIYSGDGIDDTLLVEVPNLSSGFVHLRLVIVPDTDLVAVWVDQVFRGSFNYFRFNNHNKRYFIAQPLGSDAEFDYISVRVADGS